MEFLNFLHTVVTNMDLFGDDITTVYIEQEEDKFVATGNHPKRRLFYRAEATADTPLSAPGCFGTIKYLKHILSSLAMKTSPVANIIYSDGQPAYVKKVIFRSERLETTYQCTSPVILNDRDRIRKFPRPNEAIFFPVDKVRYKEFNEIAHISKPKAEIRLFQMVYDGTYIRTVFPGAHTSNLILAGADEVTGISPEPSFTRLLDLERFLVMLRLGSTHQNARAAFHPKVCWIDFTTADETLHTVAIPVIEK